MRCTFCNVDLEDTQQFCPLCAKPAVDEKPRTVRLTNPYPPQEPSAPGNAKKQ